MPLKTQVCPLSKAMDSDSGDKYINTSDGWVRERVGMRTNGLDGNSLFNNKLKGNVLIDITLPVGINKCIGWTPDFKTESIIWFIYNSSGNHSILRYFIVTETIQKIWYSQSGLGLVDAFIDASVVDGRIYWINGTQHPKSFNIERAVNYTNSLSGDAYLSTDDIGTEILPLIKRPPEFAPTAYYASLLEDDNGLTVSFNNLRGKLFQFKYNFVYEDDQESAYSEVSAIPLPEGELTISGSWVETYSTNNAIKVVLKTGSGVVKKINVAARIANSTGSNEFNVFKIVEKFDSSGNQLILDGGEHKVSFLNNGIVKNINTPINNRYYDDVPISASGLSLIAGKYLSMSMPIKGYSPVIADMSITHDFVTTDFGASIIYMEMDSIGPNFGRTNWYVTIPAATVLNSTYRFVITFGDDSRIEATYEVDEVDPGADVIRDALYANLIADSRLNTTIFKKIDSVFFTNAIFMSVINDPTPTDVKGFNATIESGSVSSKRSFKRGQYHKIGIIYNDEFGRYSNVNNFVNAYVPYHNGGAIYDRLSVLLFQINHRPPIWAKTWRFVYIKNSSYSYFTDVVRVRCIAGGTALNNIPSGHTFIKVNQAMALYRDSNQNVVIPDYVWIKGDKCRAFYQKQFTPSPVEEENAVYVITGAFTRSYKESTASDAKTLTEDGFLVDGIIPTRTSSDNISYIDLEIFRPNFESNDVIFYETGDSYEVLNAGTETRCHAATRVGVDNDGINQSGDLNTPASGKLMFGDVYMRQRITPEDIKVIEDSGYSDFYESDAGNTGRVTAMVSGKVEQKELYRVVRSENFIENTEYNLLNIWMSSTNFFTVSESYGKITGIKEVGDVLKVIQEHKETSVYIAKAQLKQGDGTNITVISDEVFNQGNKYDSLFGTKYPHSIAANNRNLYYFDDTTGDLIRSAPNGQASISEEYRMKTYFKAKADELRISTNFTDIITAIDSNYDEVLITFINGNESETIAFYEKEGLKGFVWKAQIKPASGVFDNMGWYGNKLFSFFGGKIYEQNIGNLNEFFGDQKDCSISFIVNAGAGDANKFSNIELSSNKNIWDIQFDIEAGLNYPVQKSILKPTIIRSKENRLYSDILKNILGRNNTEDISKLRRGQDMTGETMLVTISSSTSEDVTLKEVEVKFLTSK